MKPQLIEEQSSRIEKKIKTGTTEYSLFFLHFNKKKLKAWPQSPEKTKINTHPDGCLQLSHTPLSTW